jgi:hypothetical protein
MKDLVEKIKVNSGDLKGLIDYLAENEYSIINHFGLTTIIRYLLKENEINKARIDILV